jgi:beta-lactamase class A
MHRRDAVALLVSAGLAPFIGKPAHTPLAITRTKPDFRAIERDIGGRLGVAAFDVETGRHLAYRADERFPMCSTFKWLLVAQILARVDAGAEQLTRSIGFGPADLLDHAPVTRAHVAEGRMTISELAEAAIQLSDNTAGNLLLRAVGGPASLTEFLRRLGDRVTRLDRTEPALNSAERGDVRDTTTPSAMVMDMRRLLIGERLHEASRDRLRAWLEGSTTGARRLRAGLPRDWRIGDKTGAGGFGATNDVAIIWPPARRPALVAAFVAESAATIEVREGALAAVGRSVAEWSGAS